MSLFRYLSIYLPFLHFILSVSKIKVPVSPAHSKPNNVKINQVIWISSGSESSSSGSEDASDGYSDSGSNSNNSGSESESAQVSGSPSASGEESSSSESSCDREEEEVEEVIDLTSRNSDDSDGSVDNKTSSSLNHSSSSSSSSSSSASHDKAAGPDADAISVPDSSDCARSRSRDARVSSTEEGKEGEGEVVNHSRPSTSENLMNGEENVSSPKTNEEGGCGIAMDSSSPFLSPREKLKQEKEYQESDMEEWKRRQEVIRQQSQRARARRKKIKEENSRIEKRLKELKSEREKGEKELSEANRVRPSIRKKIQNRLNGSTYFPSVARKLGLTSSLDPTFAEMTKVYKKAILKYHPDRINKSFSVIEKVTHEELFKVLQSSFQSYK